jgi:hypothetical protein
MRLRAEDRDPVTTAEWNVRGWTLVGDGAGGERKEVREFEPDGRVLPLLPIEPAAKGKARERLPRELADPLEHVKDVAYTPPYRQNHIPVHSSVLKYWEERTEPDLDDGYDDQVVFRKCTNTQRAV